MDAQKKKQPFVPDPSQMALWPEISGNSINGLGEKARRRPSPVYWHRPDTIPHGPLQDWFGERFARSPEVVEARERRQAIIDRPIPEVVEARREETAARWSELVKAKAVEFGADDAGVAVLDPSWIFEGHEQASWTYAIAIAVSHDYEALKQAPQDPAAAEVINQYGRALKVVRALTGWVHEQGWDAEARGGPNAGAMIMIPAAIAAGLGELGRHGSMIHRKYGSNFRLGLVLTNLPLEASEPDVFGADDFCTNCRVCSDACPPDAIPEEKQWVRGIEKWYVDFDRCLPFFNEYKGCAICIAVCPWSRPGVADNLVAKMARRRAKNGT